MRRAILALLLTFPASGYPLVWSWSGDLFDLLLTSDGKFGFQDWADSITGGGTQLQLSPGSFTDVVVMSTLSRNN